MKIKNLIHQRSQNQKNTEIKSQEGISFPALQAIYRSLKNQDIPSQKRHRILHDLLKKTAPLRATRQKNSLVTKIHTILAKPADNLVNERRMMLINRMNLQCYRIPLFNHLVLDSLTPYFNKYIHDEGIGRGAPLVFLINQLEAFASKCEGQMKEQVLNLQQSLDFTFKIDTICSDFHNENQTLVNHEELISLLLSQALERLKADPMHTPIALCTGTEAHGVVLKISYSAAAQYTLTVLNTGEGAILDQDRETLSDLQFSELSHEDFKTISKRLLQISSNYNVFIHELINDCNRKPSTTTHSHNPQKGNSCVSKSLALFLKLSMDTCLNKKFKVFLTKTLLNSDQADGRVLLGRRILEKRSLKYHWHLLQDLTSKEISEQERETAVKHIMHKYAYHYIPDQSSIENAESAMRRLHESWEHVSDPEEITKLIQYI